MYCDFLGSDGLQETHMDALLYVQFQIGNIDSEWRFLYKIRHPGPSCSAACRACSKRRAAATLRCQCSPFSSSLNTPWKLRSKMKIWNLFEELGIADKTKVKHFCKSQCSFFSSLLKTPWNQA